MSESLEKEIRALRAHFWSDRDPDGRAFAPLADAYRRKGDLSEADALLSDGLGRLPRFTPGLLVAARVARERGRRDEAKGHLDRLIELDEENVIGLVERSYLLAEVGDEAGAASDRQMAERLEPGSTLRPDEIGEGRGSESSAEGVGEDEGAGSAGSPEAESPSEGAAKLEWEFESTAWSGDEDEVEHARESDSTVELEAQLEDGAGMELEPEAEPEDGFEVGIEPEAEPEDGFEAGIEPEPASEAVSDFEAAFDSAFGTGDEDSEEEEPLRTRTMGELYAKQGLTDRAIEVFEHLAENDPGNVELAARLAELKGHPEAPDSVMEADPEEEDPEQDESLSEDSVDGGSVEGDPGMPEEDTEREEEDLESPDALNRDRPIGEYFVDLLSWVPGAIPIETLAPRATDDDAVGGWEASSDATPPAEGLDLNELFEEGAGEAEADSGEAPDEEDDPGEDEFQSWLRSLGP